MALYYYEIPAKVKGSTKTVTEPKLNVYENEKEFIKAHKDEGVPDKMMCKTGREWLKVIKVDPELSQEALSHKVLQSLGKPRTKMEDMRETLEQSLKNANYGEMLLAVIAQKGKDADIWVTKRTPKSEPQVWHDTPPLQAIIASTSKTFSDGYTQRGVLMDNDEAQHFVSERIGRSSKWTEEESAQVHKGKQTIALKIKAQLVQRGVMPSEQSREMA